MLLTYASTKKQSEWTKLKYNFIIFAHLKFSIKFNNNKAIFPHDQKKKKKKHYETVLMITTHLFRKRKLYSTK